MTLTQILSKLKSLVYSKTETDTLLGNKAASSHTHSDYVPKSGGAVMTGNRISRVDNTYELCMDGGSFFGDGATLTLFGKNTSNSGHVGAFWLTAYNTTECTLRGAPDGSLTWGGKNLAMQEDTIPRSGGAVLEGQDFKRTVDNSTLNVYGGQGYGHGALLQLTGTGDVGAGEFNIQAHDGVNNKVLKGKADGTLTWGAKNLAMQEDTVPRSGGSVLTGIYLGRNVNNDSLELAGGSSWNNGGSFVAYGKDQPDWGGSCLIHAFNGTNETHMWINPNGTATLNSKNLAMYEDVIPRSGGAVITGQRFSRTVDDNELVFSGGTDWQSSATLALHSKGWYQSPGGIWMQPCNDITSSIMQLLPDGTWTWQGTAVQLVSDQRLKQQISEIDDRLLDAWEDVLPCQFKYNDAVDQKGDTARLHTGYVVQQIDEACKSHNLDISAYGLYCHEEYPEETEEVEVEQEDGTKIKERKVIREASEHYSLRYTETLVVECAFLRREVKRLSERLSKLEQPSTSEK